MDTITTADYLDSSGQLRMIDVDRIRRELHYCRQTQSWSHNATRTDWVSELADLLEAIETNIHPGKIGQLLRVAEVKAIDLATEVLNRDCGQWMAEAAELHELYDDRLDPESLYDALYEVARDGVSEREVAQFIIDSGAMLNYEPKSGDWIEINPKAGTATIGVYVRSLSDGHTIINEPEFLTRYIYRSEG